MAPKRAKKVTHCGTSSSTQSNVSRFLINAAAQSRFEHAKIHRRPIPKRGFALNLLNLGIPDYMSSRGWETFAAQPRAAVIPIVREFYANAPEGRDYKAFVRGRMVPYDSTTINSVLGVQQVEDSVFQA